jgi:hypothetical protein
MYCLPPDSYRTATRGGMSDRACGNGSVVRWKACWLAPKHLKLLLPQTGLVGRIFKIKLPYAPPSSPYPQDPLRRNTGQTVLRGQKAGSCSKEVANVVADMLRTTAPRSGQAPGPQERLRRMDRFRDVPLPMGGERSYQGSHSKLAMSWYGLTLPFALRSECGFVLAGLKASHVQPAARRCVLKEGPNKCKKM